MKNLILSLLWLTALITVFLYLQGILPLAPYQPGQLSTEEILAVINQTRQQHGLKELTQNQLLTKAAEAKAANLFEEQYFQHTSHSGKIFSDFIKNSNYSANRLGENLAKNITQAKVLIQSWLDSAPHRENLLNPYFQEIGLSVLIGKLDHKKTTLVVSLFGEPKEKAKENF